MSAFDDPRLSREFSPNAWARGRQYFEDGRVIAIRTASPEPGWQAQVLGSLDRPYDVRLRAYDDAAMRLSASCTCPATPPCKHVAALLWAVRGRVPASTAAKQALRRPVYDGEDLGALRRWTEGVVAPPQPEPSPARSTKRLVFVVTPRAAFPGAPSRLGMDAHAVFIRKNGEFGSSTPYDMRAAVSGYGEIAKYVSDDDRILWYRLTRLRNDFRFASPTELLRDAGATALFRDFVATGRCHFLETDGPPLSFGEPRRGRVQWRSDAAGRQRLTVVMEAGPDRELEEDAEVLLPLSPLHYLVPSTGRTGVLELPMPQAVVDALVDLPRLEPETVAELPVDLGARLDSLAIPRPQSRRVQWLPDSTFVPGLWLGIDPSREPGVDGLDNARAVLRFDYGPLRLKVGPDYDPMLAIASVVSGAAVLKLERDAVREAQCVERLGQLGLQLPTQSMELTLAEPRNWIRFTEHALPQLRRDGWTIEIDPDFPVQVLEVGEWYMRLSESADAESSGAAWFALELGVDVDGETVNLLPAVVAAIHSGRLVRDRIAVGDAEIPLALGDGRWVSLPADRLAKVLDTLVELFDERLVDGRVRVNAFDSGRLLEFEGFAWRGDTTLRGLAEQLTRRTPLPKLAPPWGLQAELREYQQSGLAWLSLLREHGFGGVLADDMGLGKTVQTLAHLLVEKLAGRLDRPCLVVAPRTVLHNWVRECARFTPGLRCAVFHGPDRAVMLESELPDVLVTTYALLHRDEWICANKWHIAILDEAQAIKNPRTAVARAARTLDARQRLCLTGTPLENSLEDLWSLFAFATPGLLGNHRQFMQHYRRPIERDGDAQRLAALSARVAPFLLRRTKQQVLSELPPKTEVLLTIPMGRRQRDLYESVRLTMDKRVREALRARGLARSQIVVLDALLKLRQVCCHPALVKTETAARSGADSAKTDRLIELLTELRAEGRRAIVFSQFASMLAIIAEQLDAQGVDHQRITGKTTKRQEIVDAFQAGEFSVLLISLKAGGTGINLTAADVVVHYDPWWNPAVEEQATDRAHRIGQTRPITVYRLVCEGTVEQGVMALQQRKRVLTGAIQRDAEQRSAAGLRLAETDVAALLAPIDR